MISNQKKAYIYAALTVLFWSTVATAFKIALREYYFIQLLLVANFISLLIFTCIILFRKKQLSGASFTLKYLLLSALQGLLNPFFYYLLLFKAYSLLPAQVAQPANFIWPVMLMLLSVPLLNQKVRISGILSLLISFTGVVILASQGNIRNYSIPEPFGIGLALFSSVIWALFWIINMRDKRDNVEKLFLSFLFSMIFIFVTALCTDNLKFSVNISLFASVYVGVFEMGITFIFWLKALQLSASTDKVSNLVYLTPFLSLILIRFVLGEHLHVTSIIGLLMVVSGIIIQQTKKPDHKNILY
ncbi:MAG: DMT family transporter [Bacteroidales bacterium]|nr:DMT family transporter [Bacteroidales bacterium]